MPRLWLQLLRWLLSDKTPLTPFPLLSVELPEIHGKTTHTSILANEFHGLYSPWGHKKSDTAERLSLSREQSPRLSSVT